MDLSSQEYDSLSLPNFDECLHGYLGSITSLDLANNHLTKFPIGLSSLPALGELCLSHNLIEEVPRSIGKMVLHPLRLRLHGFLLQRLVDQLENFVVK